MIGYDCEAKSLNVTTMSLLDIDECQPPKEELKIEKQYVQLLQVNNFESVKVTQCKVEIQRNIYYCGKLDHLFAVDHGTAEYVHEVTKQACEGAHNSGVYYHGLHTIGGLKVNQTTSHSLSLAGSAAHNGVCTRGNYADPYGTWENVVVLGMLRITLQEQMAKGPGYMALNAGEVIHILKCIPVEVRLQHGEHCYAELQVSRGNSTYFLTPKTHILKKKGTQVGCNMILPPYYLIDDVWYKILPKPTEAKDPITIRPESRPTWNYISPKYLATSGIYTEKDLDDLSRALMFPLERPALLNGFARELHGATITTKDGTIIRLMNDDVIDKLVETTWGRLWSKFMSFGSASAGVIAILMILHIVKLAVDVILNGVALHRAYGWSMHMFAACLGSLTHLLVNAGRYNEAPNQEDATEMIPINEQPTPAAPIATSTATEALLQRAERAREFGAELGREADELRRELERATRDCSHEDRSLCAVIDPSGLHLGLRLDRVARDDRLLRLRSMGRDNLTEAGRQARGEYLYVPHHVARTTLDARNLIRREVNTARAKVSDDSRGIEAGGHDVSNQLDNVRRLADRLMPYVNSFEYVRWFVGFGTTMCVLLIWIILLGALCCRCSSGEHRVKTSLLFVFLSIFVSIGLWLVLLGALTIAAHAEMLICRPLEDPQYRTLEAVLETRALLGRRVGVPLKDLFE
ncbi:hypothetical protein TKK_0007094 [Trichogramma kaykai]